MQFHVMLVVGWLALPVVSYAIGSFVIGLQARGTRRLAPLEPGHRLDRLRADRDLHGYTGGRMPDALRLAEGSTSASLRTR